MWSTNQCRARSGVARFAQRCGTKSVSTFARRYRASKSFPLRDLTTALDNSIVSTLSKTQNRSFSHLYRRHKGSLYTSRRRSPITTERMATELTLDASHLLKPGHRRSFSASYRHHHVSLLARLSKIFFPALLPPKESSATKYRTKSVPEILASRSFSHTYRERQLAPIRQYLPSNPFSQQGRRASTVPVSSYLPRGQVEPTDSTAGRRIWRLRLLAAGITSLLALGFVLQSEQSGDALPALSEAAYLPWTVVAVDEVSPTTSIFTLKTDSVQPLSELPLITSVSIKEPNANIQRPYTVLTSSGDTIQLLVRRYESGDLSRYIHNRRIDGILHLKQARTAVLPESEKYTFIVGGTGIAPAYQVLRRFATAPIDERPNINIVYASRSKDEVYLRHQLDTLQAESGGKVKVTYFVDDESTIKVKNLAKIIGKSPGVTVVCGSDGFISYIAGTKPEDGQGLVGGLLAKVGITQDVLKL